MSPEHSVTSDEAKMEIIDLRRETMELRLALERERRHRIGLEEHIAILQQQQTMYPRKIEVDRYVVVSIIISIIWCFGFVVILERLNEYVIIRKIITNM